MPPFKRADWNELIDEVNSVLEDPPSSGDCEPLPPIEHVGENHRWAKSDVREVQDAIKETCPDIEFDEIPDLWKQSILDEIRDKLGEAWCDCECDPDGAGDNSLIILRSLEPEVLSNCFGDSGDSTEFLAPLIHGMQVGPEGYGSRTWRVLRVRSTGSTGIIATGNVACDGTIVYVGNAKIPFKWGIYVDCADCGSAFCASQLQEAENNLDEVGSVQFRLSVNTDSAVCQDCP